MHDILKRVITTLPYTLPVFIATFTVIAVSFLVLDFYASPYVWGVGLAFSFVLSFFTYKYITPYVEISRKSVISTIAVLLLCVAWFMGNTQFTSRHVFIDRDPGIYSSAAIWLINHDNLRIEKDEKIFGNEMVGSRGSGFDKSRNNDDELAAQGAHALPALLGLAGRIVGVDNMLQLIPMFGAAALFTFYGFIRLFVKKNRWAIAGTLLLSISLPLIYFSRDIYTEPLALIFTFGTLPLLYFGQKTNNKILWLVAGMVAGAGMLTRIDALLAVAGMIVAAFIAVNVADKKVKGHVFANVAIFVVVLLALFGLAYYDLAHLSSAYLSEHLHLIKPQIAVVIGIIILGCLYTIFNTFTEKIGEFYNKHKKVIALSIAYVTGLVGIVLLSRPLWYVGHGRIDNPIVQAAQTSNGLTVDGWRTYAENSVEWMTWYVGGVTILLAFIGLIIVVRKMCVSSNILYVSLVTVVGGAAIVYLNVPSITADHIWAARRFLPVVIPGIIVLAVFALASTESMKQKFPQYIRRHITPALFGLLSLCFVGTAITTQPFITTRTYDNQLMQVEQVCATLPKDAALLLYGGQTFMAVQTFRSVCGDIKVGHIPAARDLSDETIKQINNSVQKDGRQLYIGALSTNVFPLSDNGISEPFNTSTFLEYESTLIRRPQATVSYPLDFYLGKVTNNGQVVPIGTFNE